MWFLVVKNFRTDRSNRILRWRLRISIRRRYELWMESNLQFTVYWRWKPFSPGLNGALIILIGTLIRGECIAATVHWIYCGLHIFYGRLEPRTTFVSTTTRDIQKQIDVGTPPKGSDMGSPPKGSPKGSGPGSGKLCLNKSQKDSYRICRNKRPTQNKRPPKKVIFQGGEYTKPMGCDGWFFEGGRGVHRMDGFWWVIFQRGEYTKPMGFDGFWWVLEIFLLLLKIKRSGRLFWQTRYVITPRQQKYSDIEHSHGFSMITETSQENGPTTHITTTTDVTRGYSVTAPSSIPRPVLRGKQISDRWLLPIL